MPKCIYCLVDKAGHQFAKTEHVLPQAFGVFKGNMTRIDIVCDECNQYFGNELELAFARDTPDGLERFMKGNKEPREYRSRGRKSAMTFHVDEGPLRGAQGVQRPVDNEMRFEPLPQVGFSAPGEHPIEWFPFSDLPTKQALADLVAAGRNHIHLLNVVDLDDAGTKLRALGFEITQTVSTVPPYGSEKPRIEWRANLGDGAGRTVTKIALNYLASQRGAAVALRSEFDGARRYARYADAQTTNRWSVEHIPLISSTSGHVPKGHALTLGWEPDGFIVAQLTFHNSRTYRVKLAEGVTIAQREHGGHFFNTETKEISPIGPSERM